MCTSRGVRAFAVLALSVAMSAALVMPNAALAVPVYYSDEVVAGFDPEDVAEAGLTPFGSATSSQQIITSNSEAGLLQVVRAKKRPKIVKRPQNKGRQPSPERPFIAKIKLRIIANQDLEDVILAFTGPIGDYLAGTENVGVNVRKKVKILQYTSLDPDLELPAYFIGDMKKGKRKKLTLKLYVTGPMPLNLEEPGGVVLPALGMTAFAGKATAPEPPLVLLLLLAGLSWGIVRRPFGRSAPGGAPSPCAPRGAAGPCAPRGAARRIVSLAALVALVATPALSFARDEADVLAIRARTLAERGSCEDSMQVLDRIGPRTTQGDLWLGKCYVGERNYLTAVPFLERASQSGGSLEAELFLGIARYHLGDLEDARQNFARARLGGVSDPQLDLYEGVLLLDSREYEAAAAAFGRARASGSAGVEPVASFYEAVALRRAGRTDEADELFSRVADDAPGTAWGARARRATEPVNLLGPPRRWAQVTVGGGYDSNVVFKGDDVDLPSGTSGRSALFGAWAGEVGYEVARTSHMQVGVIGSYAGSAYNSLKEFNSQVPRIGGWMDYVFDESTAVRVRYDFAFMWAGHESFASGHTVDSVLFHEWGEAGRTELEAGYYWLNYKYSPPDVGETCGPGIVCGPAGVDERHSRNRDGHGLVAGLTQVVPVGPRNTNVRTGYRYHRYFSRGNDYSFQGHEVHAGFDTDLPADIKLDARASYTYQPYEHPSTFPDPSEVFSGVPYSLSGTSRRDNIFRLDVSMSRRLTRRTELEARYTYVDNESNTDVFDFDRQIFGLYLTARFQ